MTRRHSKGSDPPVDTVHFFPGSGTSGNTSDLFQNSSGKTAVIQKAGPAHIHTLSGLIRMAYRDVAIAFTLTEQNCPKHPSNCTEKWIERDFDRGVAYYLLLEDGIPAGCAALEAADSETAYLERLAVLPEFRHQGFGKKLVAHLVDTARQMNTKILSIGIIAEQEILRKWYESLGFTLIKTKKFDHLPFTVGFMNFPL